MLCVVVSGVVVTAVAALTFFMMDVIAVYLVRFQYHPLGGKAPGQKCGATADEAGADTSDRQPGRPHRGPAITLASAQYLHGKAGQRQQPGDR